MRIAQSFFLALIIAGNAFGSDGQALQTPQIDLSNKESLQRGAKIFMNYCSGCHSLKYLRYNRMAEDIGITNFLGQVETDLLKNNLIFSKATIYDPILIAMPPEDAKQWFGMVPPDLSLTTRSRGTAWLYTYLKSFYEDKSRPFGANNLLFTDVAMPNVLYPLIGKTVLVKEQGNHSSYLQLISPGSMSQLQFDDTLNDLVNFLAYVGAPEKIIRHRIGVFVLGFLFVLFVLAYRLKKVYWQRLK